ncbi:phenylalanine--tRNA ligase subunit beta [SAR202 cluster bacterium AD-802-E10_MRT_200m]|nr:phenylalanine--tRNA ligase subunit beta [SAR202 cluster bacterium AD-802-E10_MRT_200m]
MYMPFSWLDEMVESKLSPTIVAERLTMAGLEVTTLPQSNDELANCWVGQVLSVEPHHNADRLKICKVIVGEQEFQVVCGAPNVAENQNIAFAAAGASLVNPQTGNKETLTNAKIRGVTSEGMICSEKELGLGEDESGILILPPNAIHGQPLHDLFQETILEIEIPANRPDGLSMLGLAHEESAIFNTGISEPPLEFPESNVPITNQMHVEVKDLDLCGRYTASLVTGIKVAPSPKWMQDRLIQCGMRPINNVVDITNYVMLESGQPLHAFDFNKINGSTIVVRQATSGESFIGLDGTKRQLRPPMLVISDAKRAIGLAGIIGGANTEVSSATTTVLLEAASFHAFNTRRTGTELRLRTEASLRFEKGERTSLPPIGLRRATRLLLELAGGTASKGIIDTKPTDQGSQKVKLTMRRLVSLLGAKIPLKEVRRTLSALGFNPIMAGNSTLEVTVPYWRADITIEDDLIEEVARVIGYDKIPTTMLSTSIPYRKADLYRTTKEKLRDTLTGQGFQEIVTYPLISQEIANISSDWSTTTSEPLKLYNPLRPEHKFLRTELASSMLMTLTSNRRFDDGPILLFEIGRVYLPNPGDLPQENELLTAVLSGPTILDSWLETPSTFDFYHGKGAVEGIMQVFGLTEKYARCDEQLFHPGRAAVITSDGKVIGQIGEVLPHTLTQFNIEKPPVTIFQIHLNELVSLLSSYSASFMPPPKFPAAERDLALLVDSNLTAGQILNVIYREPLIQKATLFDVYTGSQVPKGKRSLAYRLLFQSNERTLIAKEVDQAISKILAALEVELGAARRQF